MEKNTKYGLALGLVLLVLVAGFAVHYRGVANETAKELSTTKSTLDETVKKQQEQNVQTQAALSALLNKVEKLNTQVEDNEKKTTELNSQLNETKSQLNTKAQEAEAARAEIASLQAQLKNNGTQSVSTVVGEILDSLYLNDAVNFVVDDQDVPELIDGTIEFDGTNYDVHEEFRSVNGQVVLGTSLTEDEKFSSDARLMLTQRGSLVYTYVFDEPVNVNDISNEEPLKIRLLGQNVEFVKVTNSQATIRSGKELVLREGSSVTVDGKTVELTLVGPGAAYVTVDGVAKVVKEFRSEKIAGLDVRVEDVLTNDDAPGMATLVVGTDTIYSQNNNDDFFDNENFTYTMNVVGNELRSISVSFDEKLDKVSGDRAALKTGEEVCFPNKFLCVKFRGLENTDYVEYRVTMDEFDEELANGTDVNTKCALVETKDDSNIEIDTTKEVSKVFVCVNGKAYYQNNHNDWFEVALTSVKLVNDKAKYSVVMGPNSSLRFVEPTGNFIELDTNFSGERLGTLKDEAESTDVKYNSMNLGKREYDVLTLYGTVIVDIESNADNDEVVLKIPSDRVEANVLVYSQ